jgi:hypothetical protein
MSDEFPLIKERLGTGDFSWSDALVRGHDFHADEWRWMTNVERA